MDKQDSHKHDNRGLALASPDALADEALARALALPPGLRRNDALKLASRLRCAADRWRPSPGVRPSSPIVTRSADVATDD
jgi:hypothetical protein